jgi:hypothetical protein
MNQQTKDILIISGVIGLVLIVKKGFSAILPTPAPDINSGLNGAFLENANNHRKYKYSLTSSQAQDIAENIYNDLGVFNDDYAAVMGELQQATTQGDVYQIAQLFKNVFNQNFWTYLSTGTGLTGLDGLSGEHLKQINDYVNSLPL